MHTKDQLASALRDVGLDEMAAHAATGYYHDFLSPLDLPAVTLIGDLAAASNHSERRAEILHLRNRVIDGDFDASIEEGEEWMDSEDGRQVISKLTGDR